jgi:hypothetical protein
VLIKLLPSEDTSGLSGGQRLELATTRFRCTRCTYIYYSRDITSERARSHSCQYGWKALDPNSSLGRICSLEYIMPWNYFKSLEFDATMSTQIARVLPLMDLDPLTATLSDFRAKLLPGECAPTFRCESCVKEDPTSIVTWDWAVC